MAGRRMIVFEPEDLYQLLVHYTEGKTLPLDGKVINFSVSRFMQRWLGLEVQAERWPKEGFSPGKDAQKLVHVRYEGKRVMTWDQNGQEPNWSEANEAPVRQ